METAIDPITMVGADGIVRFASPSVERTLGWTASELLGRQAFDFVHPADLARARRTFDRLIEQPGAVERMEVRLLHATGDWLLLNCTGRNFLDDPRLSGILLQASDTLANTTPALTRPSIAYDALTGLATRERFLEQLESAVGRPRVGSHGRPLVLALDVDRLKTVNDSIGHAAGDALLISIARRLGALLEPDDVLARLGSDEFAALLWNRDEPRFAERLLPRIHDAFREPFLIGGREIYTSLCVGVASLKAEASPHDALLEADLALGRAKAVGPGSYAVYEDDMRVAAFDRLDIESRLRHAVEREELRLYFQAIFSLETGMAIGHEALVRWMHPQRGLLGPDAFIAIAEQTGLIVDVGWWVLDAACRTAGEWLRAGRIGSDHSINVNLSARQLAQPDLTERVDAALREHRLPHGMLTLELTESVLVDGATSAPDSLAGLRALGVRIAIDDFGTGYSSLGYLHELPADTVKIDRCFISASWRGGESLEVLTAVIQLARELELQVIAEGIETEAQCDLLRSLGCTLAQGFLFARPAPARWQSELRPLR